MDRVIIAVMDSLGVGAMPDAQSYGDAGADTLGHIFEKRGSLDIPNLRALGLGEISSVGSAGPVKGSYGLMSEMSPGKDTTTGHWEMAGLKLDFAFRTYPQGFPEEVISSFEKSIGRKSLGNYASSGTEILKQLGEEHMSTGCPIVYTSADSVFQIAAHEDIIPLEDLYEICLKARKILRGEHTVGRVIARPFTGSPGAFERDNANRHDYSVAPPEDTLLDILKRSGYLVCGIGKIPDIFAHRGLTEEVHTDSNSDGMVKTAEALDRHAGEQGLFFLNLVEFDSVYGHRRDPEGYALAIERFDSQIPGIISSMTGGDMLILTADHGCDPSHTAHTDHTREYVPLLVYGPSLKNNVDLGTRRTFSDIGQTVADIFSLPPLKNGESFLGELLPE